jgi:hypothetical protein
MANSFIRYTGNGSTDTYAVSFPYRSQSDITVTIDGVATTAFTWNGAGTQITFTSPPGNLTSIQIKRTTSQTSRLVDYAAGSVLTENDLDTDSTQAFYMGQEAVDEANDRIIFDIADFNWDAQSKRIKNVADPTALQDAVTKNYLENTYLTSAVIANINTLAPISANITTVAGISSDVTAVAGDATDIGVVAGKATEIGRLGTADAVTDMNTLGTADIVTDMNLLATSANVTAMGLLGTSANVTAMGLLGTSAVITDLDLLGTSAVVTDMDLLATSGNVTNMDTLGASGVVANIATVAGQITPTNNIATVATNIADVNTFANRYRIASSDPASSLDEGDLVYNTTSNALKYYDGSSWNAITADTDVKAGVSSNDTTPDYLLNKFTAGTAITIVETNDGGDETLTINATDPTALAIALG